MEITRVLQEKKATILQLAERHGLRNVRVFGSVARGEGSPESDLDLLVQLTPGRSLLDIVAMKQDVEDLIGCRVDVVTEAAISPYIREQVLEEAVPL